MDPHDPDQTLTDIKRCWAKTKNPIRVFRDTPHYSTGSNVSCAVKQDKQIVNINGLLTSSRCCPKITWITLWNPIWRSLLYLLMDRIRKSNWKSACVQNLNDSNRSAYNVQFGLYWSDCFPFQSNAIVTILGGLILLYRHHDKEIVNSTLFCDFFVALFGNESKCISINNPDANMQLVFILRSVYHEKNVIQLMLC